MPCLNNTTYCMFFKMTLLYQASQTSAVKKLSPECLPLCKVLEERNAAKYENMSMEAFLDQNNYSASFRQHYLLPMCAAVWSSPNRKVDFHTS